MCEKIGFFNDISLYINNGKLIMLEIVFFILS